MNEYFKSDTEVYIASHLESVRKGSMDKISEFFDTVTIRKQRFILKIVGRKNIRNNPKINNTEEIAQVHIEENNGESYELAIRNIYFVSIKVDDGLIQRICYPHFKHSLT
ncbi:hypothetical protein BpHYR1_014748 [Brachionus plicatilis]|uniref:Uncharacterized protein n=1 Tax=Brachionus plicatilis TaxID=10195 RepID=A0A3M7S3Q6_BRAPC|nr:hypothetical protein BpHYR1_014748 [Brachionus plicatilis]